MKVIKTIVLEDAKKAIEDMEKKCLKLKVDCSFCVIDCMGNIIILEKMDNASRAVLEIAKGKAITALRTTMSTREVDKLIKKYDIEIAYFSETCKTAVWGGFPLYENEKGDIPVGAIGVSGGSWEQDETIAKVGIKAMNLVTK